MPARSASSQRVAIVGASSLLGKELKQVLEDRNFPATDFVLLDESHAVGTLTEAAGEPTFIQPLDEDSFEGARFAFFAGNSETAAANWEAGIRAGASVIDLTGGVPAESGAFTWIPSLDALLPAPSAAIPAGAAKPASAGHATASLSFSRFSFDHGRHSLRSFPGNESHAHRDRFLSSCFRGGPGWSR